MRGCAPTREHQGANGSIVGTAVCRAAYCDIHTPNQELNDEHKTEIKTVPASKDCILVNQVIQQPAQDRSSKIEREMELFDNGSTDFTSDKVLNKNPVKTSMFSKPIDRKYKKSLNNSNSLCSRRRITDSVEVTPSKTRRLSNETHDVGIVNASNNFNGCKKVDKSTASSRKDEWKGSDEILTVNEAKALSKERMKVARRTLLSKRLVEPVISMPGILRSRLVVCVVFIYDELVIISS